MATLKNTTINDTGFLGLPVGTTAQRPVSPATGYTRVNSSTSALEVYFNSTWVNAALLQAITATGGTITTSGIYKIHTFTTSGTFAVTAVSSNATVEVLIVGGGGAAEGKPSLKRACSRRGLS